MQGLFRHRVHGERRREGLDVEHVRGLRVLRPRAGPEEALRTGAEVVDALAAGRGEQPSRGGIGPLRHRDSKPVLQRARGPRRRPPVPAADEHRRDRANVRVEPGVDPTLDAAQVGFGRGQIVLAREEQRHVDRNTGEDRLLDGRQPFRWCPGILMKRFGRSARANRSLAAASVLAVS